MPCEESDGTAWPFPVRILEKFLDMTIARKGRERESPFAFMLQRQYTHLNQAQSTSSPVNLMKAWWKQGLRNWKISSLEKKARSSACIVSSIYIVQSILLEEKSGGIYIIGLSKMFRIFLACF